MSNTQAEAAHGGETTSKTMVHDDDEDDSELTVFVTAHPDDESMFFVPTLRHYLTQQQPSIQTHQHRHPVWLVCLTTGNYDGLGTVRSHELRHAAENILGVDRTLLLDDPRSFPDDPIQAWDLEQVVAALVQALSSRILQGDDDDDARMLAEHQHVWGTLRLITFDRDGVSGHVNHRDTFRAVQRLMTMVNEDDGARTRLLPARRVEAWSLETVHNPLVKYVPFLEWIRLILCWCGLVEAAAASRSGDTETATTTVTYRLLQPSLNWKAMAAHRSQFVWYRRLFVAFSCYTYVNRLRRMAGDDDTATAVKDTTTTTSWKRQEKLD